MRRLQSVDALRGAIMILMALDHARDFFHSGAASFSPTDLTKTTPILFLTRWITHFCMPVFMLTAGMGIFLSMQRGRTKPQLSRFLVSRGLWLIILELTVMQVAYYFNFSFAPPLFLLVLWIFGLCFIAMAGLIYIPLPSLAALSLVVIALQEPGALTFFNNGVIAPYPFIPWVAVMAAGFCFGPLLPRRTTMLLIGTAMTLAFIAIRSINRYGDPAPWALRKSPLFTLLSFLNCTKYPASPDFLLMTLGPAIVVLAWLGGRRFRSANPLLVFGRVPLFYFVMHFYAIHALVVLMAWARYGESAFTFMFNRVPSMGGPRQLFPQNFGYSLPLVYVVWILIVLALYPLCRWFARVKATGSNGWLSYL